MEFKTILLAEDNPKDAELTLEALSEISIVNNIVWVKDGEEVIDFLNRKGKFENRTPELPVVIMLDIKMPKVDGIEALAYIRSHEKFKYIPVVMLTSSRSEQDLVRTYQLGVNAYVVKPVDLIDFIEAIKQLGMFWGVVNEISEH